MKALIDEGLGLDHKALRLERTTEGWVIAGSSLRDEVAAVLKGEAEGVEHIGSSSVVDLLAKPIVDLAVGLSAQHDVVAVRGRLEESGWIYRGDAGDNGGHVLVLEARPWYRVAHIHVVQHRGSQWRDYLRLRDFLRRNIGACERYESAKVRLVDELGDDREAYTDAKAEVVRSLLREVEQESVDRP